MRLVTGLALLLLYGVWRSKPLPPPTPRVANSPTPAPREEVRIKVHHTKARIVTFVVGIFILLCLLAFVISNEVWSNRVAEIVSNISILWLLPLVVGLAAIVTLFASQPKSKGLACVATCFMLVSAAWGMVSEYKKYSDQAAFRQYAYSELEKTTRDLLRLLSQIVITSTDEWLPQNEDEFFSLRVAALVCNRLNISSQAPIIPERSWLRRIDERTREAEKELDVALTSYGSVLPKSLLERVVAVKKSFFLTYPRQWVTIMTLDKWRPPLLCPVSEDVVVEKFLTDLRELYDELWAITKAKRYQMPSEDPNVKNMMGKARFSDHEMTKWIETHPQIKSRN